MDSFSDASLILSNFLGSVQKPRLPLNSQQVEGSLLFFYLQGVKGMTPLKYVLGILVIICLTIVLFTFINRGALCELTIKSGQHEVAAKLACGAG